MNEGKVQRENIPVHIFHKICFICVGLSVMHLEMFGFSVAHMFLLVFNITHQRVAIRPAEIILYGLIVQTGPLVFFIVV